MSDQNAPKRKLRWRDSLSFRLFLIAIASVLVVEALIFIPSATNFRNNWLEDQIEAGRLAALALEAAPSRMVSEELEQDLLESAMVLAVAELYDERRDMILNPGQEICCTRKIILFDETPDFSEISDTLGTFFAPKDRFLVLRAAGSRPGRAIEIVVDESGLRGELEDYGRNILVLSLIISAFTGGLIYLMLVMTVVRPIRRVTQSVEQIGDEPGSWKRRLSPTPRGDEIGRAQNALSDMEEAVSNAFRQQERLAQLGEAVAKINHDLRNSLATAQLVSDSLSRSEDPRVAKSLPRLERALERAINLASDTLKYGRSSVPDSNIQNVRLFDIAEEAAAEALAAYGDVTFNNEVDLQANAKADPDHLHRICANLIRNAAEAMDGKGAISIGYDGAALSVADNGPGLPEQARTNLFKAFAGSTRRDGTGLGLALSRDLARAMGGDLELGETGESGTRFVIFLPTEAQGA
ncbi:MAG: HAMP domain-containing histidine kinase [Hyphomonadaceae bacterium]|nr:HAMP domain-containing histidine kinase [Hyphomonadaceae bacterium]